MALIQVEPMAIRQTDPRHETEEPEQVVTHEPAMLFKFNLFSFQPRRWAHSNADYKMNPWLIVISCMLLVGGCRSAPKSVEVINAANARTLLILVSDYSATHGAMPSSIYVLDLSHVKCGDREAKFSDLRCVSSDRKVEADFLYFRVSGSFSKVDPDLIVLASPFPPSSKERRLVVTAAGKTAYLHDSEFLNAMTKRENNGEQFAAPNGP